MTSATNVKAFIEKLNSDVSFRNQITSADSNGARLEIAREAGFEFTVEEYQQTLEQLAGESGDELTEDELETVAGGLEIDVKIPSLRTIFGGERLNSNWDFKNAWPSG